MEAPDHLPAQNCTRHDPNPQPAFSLHSCSTLNAWIFFESLMNAWIGSAYDLRFLDQDQICHHSYRFLSLWRANPGNLSSNPIS